MNKIFALALLATVNGVFAADVATEPTTEATAQSVAAKVAFLSSIDETKLAQDIEEAVAAQAENDTELAQALTMTAKQKDLAVKVTIGLVGVVLLASLVYKFWPTSNDAARAAFEQRLTALENAPVAAQQAVVAQLSANLAQLNTAVQQNLGLHAQTLDQQARMLIQINASIEALAVTDQTFRQELEALTARLPVLPA